MTPVLQAEPVTKHSSITPRYPDSSCWPWVYHGKVIEWLLMHMSSDQGKGISHSNPIFRTQLHHEAIPTVCQLHIAKPTMLELLMLYITLWQSVQLHWSNLCFGARSIPCALTECRQWNVVIWQWVSTQQGLHINVSEHRRHVRYLEYCGMVSLWYYLK